MCHFSSKFLNRFKKLLKSKNLSKKPSCYTVVNIKFDEQKKEKKKSYFSQCVSWTAVFTVVHKFSVNDNKNFSLISSGK